MHLLCVDRETGVYLLNRHARDGTICLSVLVTVRTYPTRHQYASVLILNNMMLPNCHMNKKRMREGGRERDWERERERLPVFCCRKQVKNECSKMWVLCVQKWMKSQIPRITWIWDCIFPIAQGMQVSRFPASLQTNFQQVQTFLITINSVPTKWKLDSHCYSITKGERGKVGRHTELLTYQEWWNNHQPVKETKFQRLVDSRRDLWFGEVIPDCPSYQQHKGNYQYLCNDHKNGVD